MLRHGMRRASQRGKQQQLLSAPAGPPRSTPRAYSLSQSAAVSSGSSHEVVLVHLVPLVLVNALHHLRGKVEENAQALGRLPP